jgi:hypothetical protein
MTSRYISAISRRASARVVHELCPSKNQRAQGMPGARGARGLVCKVESTRVSHHGHAGNTRHSPRDGFTVSFALSPVIGLVCHRHRRFLANLTPASRRQDHTTSPSAVALFVTSATASTASRLTSVTIAKRPSGRRDGTGYATDLGRARNGKFFDLGLDHPNHLDPLQQNSVLRKSVISTRKG